MGEQHYQTAILGSGPAGTGVLVRAARLGMLDGLLSRGLVLIDQQAQPISTTLGQYDIPSNSPGGAFLECLEHPCPDVLQGLSETPEAQAVRDRQDGTLPLPVVGRFLDRLIATLHRTIHAHPSAAVLAGHRVTALRLHSAGIQIEMVEDGHPKTLFAGRVVLALGAEQDRGDILGRAITPEISLEPIPDHRIFLSDGILRGRSRAALRTALRRSARVVILGGSHSALSICWQLLHQYTRQGIVFGQHSIEIFHRSPVRVFYPDASAARRDGFTGVRAEHCCPQTGGVHRIGGLRGPARTLYRRIRAGNEPRARLSGLDGQEQQEALRRALQRATAVIPAYGYRKRLLPIYGRDGALIPIQRGCVDEQGRLLTADGASLPIWSVGIGSGYRTSPTLGGESCFQGSVDGIWLYQHLIGERVLRGLR